MDLQVKHKDFGLSEDKANEITKGLSTIIAERDALESQYIDIVMEEITPELSEQARELRLRIRDNRTKGLVKWHKANKEYFLQGGKFVDAIKNKNIIHNEQMEEKLLAIEKHEENLEIERKKKLAESRLDLLDGYASEEDLKGVDLGEMSELLFNGFLNQCKQAKEDREKQRLEEERKAKEEAERLAKIEKENKRLQAELKAKEDAERKAKQEEVAKAKEEAERKARLANAPVKNQLTEWVNSFKLPQVDVEHETATLITEKFNSFKDWALNNVNKL